MYISGMGAPSGATDGGMKDRTVSGSLARPLGAMSKRFDVKDEPAKARATVSSFACQPIVLIHLFADTNLGPRTGRR